MFKKKIFLYLFLKCIFFKPVKLTKVTLEHKSGVNYELESLVIINIVNVGEKSIS